MTNTPSSPTHEEREIAEWLRNKAEATKRLARREGNNTNLGRYWDIRGDAFDELADQILSGEWRTLHLGGENVTE